MSQYNLLNYLILNKVNYERLILFLIIIIIIIGKLYTHHLMTLPYTLFLQRNKMLLEVQLIGEGVSKHPNF